MTIKTLFALSVLCIASVGLAFAQRSGTIVMDEVVRIPARQEILIPDLPGYLTLKCDFHMHTVFSDGVVWPTTRVDEAWEDGLDAISITDHIEGHPKKLPGQNHQAYEIALPLAKARNMILIRGGEISRSMPPGHLNAIFLEDVNALNVPDYMDAIGEAVRQGGFIMWNHPGWRKQQPDTTLWMPEHEDIYQKGWMHGIEVFNEMEWYPEALQWALEKNLAIIGNSDIHDFYNKRYNRERFPVRPITLVFARERTEESIKEAMFARRTATLFFNKLIGPRDLIEPLVLNSVKVSQPFLYQDGYAYFEVKNVTDIEFTFHNTGNSESGLPDRIVLPRRSTLVARVRKEQGSARQYSFLIENVLTGVEEYLDFKMEIR
jgi:hypothetical protein